eukprot:gene13284-13415_t
MHDQVVVPLSQGTDGRAAVAAVAVPAEQQQWPSCFAQWGQQQVSLALPSWLDRQVACGDAE